MDNCLAFWSKSNLFPKQPSSEQFFPRTENVWDSIWKIPYRWRSSTVCLIGCYMRAKIQNQGLTNQRRYTDICTTMSSVQNFSGPFSLEGFLNNTIWLKLCSASDFFCCNLALKCSNNVQTFRENCPFISDCFKETFDQGQQLTFYF